MSDYGPPTDEQIRQYHGSQARVASWVQKHAVPGATDSSPVASRSSSYSSTRSSSRSSSLPPPPPGFKYAPANTPVVYKTQAATYTVVHPSTKTGNAEYTSPRSSSRTSSSTHRRNNTYPVVTYQSPYQAHQTQSPVYYYPAAPRSKPKEKEQPLFRRLFGIGDGQQKRPEPARRHTSGSSDTKITIQW